MPFLRETEHNNLSDSGHNPRNRAGLEACPKRLGQRVRAGTMHGVMQGVMQAQMQRVTPGVTCVARRPGGQEEERQGRTR